MTAKQAPTKNEAFRQHSCFQSLLNYNINKKQHRTYYRVAKPNICICGAKACEKGFVYTACTALAFYHRLHLATKAMEKVKPLHDVFYRPGQVPPTTKAIKGLEAHIHMRCQCATTDFQCAWRKQKNFIHANRSAPVVALMFSCLL